MTVMGRLWPLLVERGRLDDSRFPPFLVNDTGESIRGLLPSSGHSKMVNESKWKAPAESQERQRVRAQPSQDIA